MIPGERVQGVGKKDRKELKDNIRYINRQVVWMPTGAKSCWDPWESVEHSLDLYSYIIHWLLLPTCQFPGTSRLPCASTEKNSSERIAGTYHLHVQEWWVLGWCGQGTHNIFNNTEYN